MDAMSFLIGRKSAGESGGGTTNYNALSNKPSINGETLSGNKTAEDLGLVAAESGKGLSTNDFTDALKSKLDGVESEAQANVLESVMVNGVALAIASKAVDLLIAAGASNGAISVNGVDVAVTGLAALAYKSEIAMADLAAALQAVINAKAEASVVNALIGGDAGKSVRTIANEELAAQLIPETAQESLDTLQEIAAWIQSHPNEVAAINRKLTLGTNGGAEYPTVKAYVEAMVAGLIKLTDLSATITGDGNAVTGVSYDNATGAFAFTKGATFLTEHQDISGKVDKDGAKVLSTNDYTTAEKQKLEGIEPEAQANEVSAEQYASALGNISWLAKENQSLRTALNNLIAGLSVPLTMTMSGTKGYLFIEDAAAGSVSALKVDSSLSGTTLYVQIRDTYANMFQSTTATVSANGDVPLSGLTVASGVNQVYVAKTAYVWAYVAPSVLYAYDENGKQITPTGKMWESKTIGADHYPTNGVDFTITYPRDKELGVEVDKGFLIWDEFLEICGYKATRTAYATTAAAIAGFNNGETVVIKTEPDINYSKYNEYAKISQAPSADSAITYYRETRSLVA